MRFRSELQTPGVRIPITADADLWTKGVEVGEEILWLHTFGQRYTDESKGRPEWLSALCETIGPRVLAEIPDVAEGMPSEIDYDPENRQLMVGGGRIGPVSRRVYEYDVVGMRIVRHWFNHRSANPRYKRRTSPLDDENCETWTSSLTDDLLALLAVLERCTQLEDTVLPGTSSRPQPCPRHQVSAIGAIRRARVPSVRRAGPATSAPWRRTREQPPSP